MARPGGFEPPTAWFVARYSIQLSYGRATNLQMAVKEGFEPSIRLQTVYSLSRGAPSASRPPHRTNHGALGRIRTSDRLVRSQVLYPAELRAHNNPGLFSGNDQKTKIMARPGGFEPPTAWFVARYSIQLSYGRALQEWR